MFLQVGDEGYGLQRLSKSHLVAEDERHADGVHLHHPIQTDHLVIPERGGDAIRLAPQYALRLRQWPGVVLVAPKVPPHLLVHEGLELRDVIGHEVHAVGIVRAEYTLLDDVVVLVSPQDVLRHLSRGPGLLLRRGCGGLGLLGLGRVGLECAVGVIVAGDDVVVLRLDDVAVDDHGGGGALSSGSAGGGFVLRRFLLSILRLLLLRHRDSICR
mmetsp:Transcript_14009/g.33973  ORF Transcript_14009/g.33973 Transcript_14009/m.33973 type:complete len:214 (+) Transcript_14009:663-1304(+)